MKVPSTPPVGGGIRSLNVALRQLLDLFVCLRPVQYFKGVPSPVRNPEKVDMVIFRENTEDIYAGIEYAAGTPEAQKVLDFFEKEFPKEFKKIRFGTRKAAEDWQAQLERIGSPHRESKLQVGPGLKPSDYLSDALAAQVGGIGIAPGGNINYLTGHAIFEATHGTAPKYANQDKVNPGSVILSGEMMLRHMGWNEAADLIVRGMDGTIGARTVTYDFARMMVQEGQPGVKELKCSEFAEAVVRH